MRLADAAERTFARHETFHPRYGWFRKAYAFVAQDSGVFSRVDAPVHIGVGKNMVQAIRFWGLAAKLIEKASRSTDRRASDLVPTSLGRRLFGDSGWDRYMEDPGTLWLLHWLLLAPCSLLPVWWLAFNEFDAVEFTDDDLEASVQMQVAAHWVPPHPSSIRKDVSALLRTYAPAGTVGTDRDRRPSRLPSTGTEPGPALNQPRIVTDSRLVRSPPCRHRSWRMLPWTTSPASARVGTRPRSVASLMSRAPRGRCSISPKASCSQLSNRPLTTRTCSRWPPPPERLRFRGRKILVVSRMGFSIATMDTRVRDDREGWSAHGERTGEEGSDDRPRRPYLRARSIRPVGEP